MNNITFTDDTVLENVLHEPDVQKSILTEWFTANQHHMAARNLTVNSHPNGHGTLIGKNGLNVREARKIGRMIHIHPTSG